MQSAESLKRRIESTEDLQSVVKTMKALAAVSIRQYEKAVEALADYNKAVEMGLQIVLRSGARASTGARSAPKSPLGGIVFGSDQGMCGQLNEQIVAHTVDTLAGMGREGKDPVLLGLGARVAGRLEDEGQSIETAFSVPNSIAGIAPGVQDLLLKIEEWGTNRGLDRVYLFYCRHLSGASFRPLTVHLLPVDQSWLARLEKENWPSRGLPTFDMDPPALFSGLIREYLFVSLYRAFAESLASENASRLASMQGAEKNIQEQLSELNMDYHRVRQMTITEELLDIVSGFEAMKREA